MAAPRLPFLWPMLRNVETSTPAVRSARAAARMRDFHLSTQRRRPDAQHQRYGTANEPPPHLGGGKSLGPASKQQAEKKEQQQKALPKVGEKLQHDGEAENQAESVKSQKQGQQLPDKQSAAAGSNDVSKIQIDPMLDASEHQPIAKPPDALGPPDGHAMDTLLNTVPDPGQPTEESQASAKQKSAPEDEESKVSWDEHAPPVKAPHIETPRYVHHFDTYGLVRQLVESGWKEEHAITGMKAVRLMLADNMDLAREALVSKSQIENETYLFRAACAELKTEVTARRISESDKMRSERDHLQHEVEILSQKLGQESGVLKDELKGMFDDRKMAVRNEQRTMESKIQRLNYQITVDLQADAKSEVEGLRWIMTRRVITALGVVILMVLGSLKLYSNAIHEQELDAKRRANMKSSSTQTNDGLEDNYGNAGSRGMSSGAVLAKEGEYNPAFVSLG